MDNLSNFQRKAILFLFISILAGAILLSRKEPLKKHYIKDKEQKNKTEKIEEGEKAYDNSAKIDINTASISTLCSLPGIGPGLAKQIIDYRKKHGPFTELSELNNVPGLGPKRIERIEDRLSLKKEQKEVQSSKYIDINSASSNKLCTVPGIGPKMAQKIINYRIKNNGFKSLEELMNVPGIGQKRYDNFKDYLCIAKPLEPPTQLESSGFIDTRKTTENFDSQKQCSHCKAQLWEKGKKKKVFIRCPYCLKLLSQKK